jgi:hypothetical protein
VEYAVVFAGFLAVVVALGVFRDALQGGLLVEHALACAPHHVSGVVTGVVSDVFLV